MEVKNIIPEKMIDLFFGFWLSLIIIYRKLVQCIICFCTNHVFYAKNVVQEIKKGMHTELFLDW